MNPLNKAFTWLFNPFYYLAGGKGLGLGLLAIVLAALVGFCGHTHFDGVLDAHVGAAAPLWLFLFEGVLDWACLAVVLWLGGKLISDTAFRAIDIFGTQALARWPTLLISLIALPPGFRRFANDLVEQIRLGSLHVNVADGLVFGVVVMGMIVLVCWVVALMFKSFLVACNVKGGKAIGVFIAGVLIAEVLSKVCLASVLPHALAVGDTSAQSANSGQAASGSPTAAGDAADDLSGRGSRFVELLAKQDFAGAESQFDDAMKRALPESKLTGLWQDLEKQFGPFQKQTGTRRQEQAGYHIVFVTCQFERVALDVKVVFDNSQQVAGLFYVPARR